MSELMQAEIEVKAQKWPMVKLGELTDKVKSWNPLTSSEAEPFIYIDLSSVDKESKKIDGGLVANVLPFEAPSRARQLVQENDVIVANVRPNLNGVALIESKYNGSTASTGYCVLRPKENKLCPKYLFYWVQTDLFIADMMSKATGANYPAVSDRIIKDSLIPLPPLEEQKRIAAILDKADAIRRKRQQAIDLADEFLRSVFLDMFGDPVTNPKGWEETILKDVADIRSGVTKGKKIDPITALMLPYMRVANVQDGYLSLEDIQEIMVSPSDAKKCKLMAGDILLTEGGDPDKLGRGHVWNDEVPNCIHQNHIFSVRIKDRNLIRPQFLSALISSQRGKRYFLRVGKQTTGIATINKTVLSEFKPFIPSIAIQDKYIAICDFVWGLKEESVSEGMDFFKSLSQKAFSGQL